MNISEVNMATGLAKQVLSTALLVGVLGCVSGAPRSLPTPVSAPAEDLVFYADRLTALHKNAFSRVTPPEFWDQVDRAVVRLDTLVAAGGDGELALYGEACRLSALVGDSHTWVAPGQKIAARLRTYAVRFAWVEGRWYVVAAGAGQEFALGAEVAALNDRPLDEVLAQMATLVGHDNPTFLARQCRALLSQPDTWEFLGLAAPGAPLAVTLADGRTFEAPAGPAATTSSLRPLAVKKSPWSPGTEWYRWVEWDDVLLIQYNRCQDWAQYPMESFTSEVLKRITVLGRTKVVVDLRYNGGGNSAVLAPLIDGLTRLRQERGTQLFVLVGPQTFSSAILNASQLVRAGAVVVGEPTGGSLNHFGEVRGFSLPHSGIEASYSTKFFLEDPSAPDGSLIPDVMVVTTLADAVEGRDPQLAYCLGAPD